MTKLFFMRHGKTKQNQNHLIQGRINSMLSEEGISAAHKAGKYLKDHNYSFDEFISSPLDRAKDTLSIVIKEMGIDKVFKVEDGLIEREFGEIEGEVARASLYFKIVTNKVKGMETSSALQNRMKDIAIKIAKENEGKNVLIVSHSHAIKGLLTAISKKRSFTDIIRNLSLTEVDYVDGKLKIKYMNKNTVK